MEQKCVDSYESPLLAKYDMDGNALLARLIQFKLMKGFAYENRSTLSYIKHKKRRWLWKICHTRDISVKSRNG